MSIRFYSDNIHFKLRGSRKINSFIKTYFAEKFNKSFDTSVVFCSKDRILDINITALNHNYYTDIITFPYSDSDNIINAEIYICIDVVKENAIDFNTDFYNELHRVIFHGFVHLVGYKDKTKQQQLEMRKQEDIVLAGFYKCST